MVSSIDEVLEHADTIVIGNAAPEFRDIPRDLGFVRPSSTWCGSPSPQCSGVYEGFW